MSKHGAAPRSGSSASSVPAWLPPDDDDSFTVPLNLPKELARIGIGADDRVILENLPQGAALTIGEQKPDGSWILLPDQLAIAEYIPLTHNGQTYYLQLNVLTSDPSDHGLPKTKARLKIAVKVPEAKLPPLNAFPMPEPAALPPPPSETVIHLPAGPHIGAAPAPQPLALPAPRTEPSAQVKPAPTDSPAPVAMTTTAPNPVSAPAPAAEAAAAPEPIVVTPATVDLDKHFDLHAAEWTSLLRDELQAAERRLKATQTEQLARIRAALTRDEAARATAIEAGLKAGSETCKMEPPESELAASEASWKSEIARRIASAEVEWRKAEAERMTAAESRWRAEHEQRLESVLANFGLLVRDQLGGSANPNSPPAEIHPAGAAQTRWSDSAAA